jgi:hypothetical protein
MQLWDGPSFMTSMIQIWLWLLKRLELKLLTVRNTLRSCRSVWYTKWFQRYASLNVQIYLLKFHSFRSSTVDMFRNHGIENTCNLLLQKSLVPPSPPKKNLHFLQLKYMEPFQMEPTACLLKRISVPYQILIILQWLVCMETYPKRSHNRRQWTLCPNWHSLILLLPFYQL